MSKINIDKIYNYFLLLFCFTLPLTHLAKAIPNIMLIALAVLFPFHSLRNSVKIIKKELVAILSFITIIIINTALFSRWEDSKEFTKLLYIPLILLLFFPTKDTKPYTKSFIFGTFSLLFLSSIQIVLRYINEGISEIALGEELIEILLGERPYVGFLYFMSACFSFYFYTCATKNIYRIIYIALLLIFCGFIFLIAARLALLLIIISVALALFYLGRKIKFNFKYAFLLSLFLIGLLYAFSGNISKRLYIGRGYEKLVVTEPRYYIWDCIYNQLFPDNPKDFIFGKGYKNVRNELLECYVHKDNFTVIEQQEWFIDKKFNTHNQFFDLFLGQGIIVFALCLFFFAYAILKNRNNFFAISMLLSMFLFFSVENVLNRQLGCMIVALVLWFILKQKSISEDSTTDNLAR